MPFSSPSLYKFLGTNVQGSTAYANLTTGQNNIALGQNIELLLTSGNRNIGLGNNSLENITADSDNIAIGYYAINSTGARNVAVGNGTLRNGSGSDNVAIGSYNIGDGSLSPMYNNISGDRNIAIGNGSLVNVGRGNGNISIGYNSGVNLSGGSNVFLGENAGLLCFTVNDSVLIGTASNAVDNVDSVVAIGSLSQANASNAVALGSGAIANFPNSVAIGAGAVANIDHAIILGDTSTLTSVGIGLTIPQYELDVAGIVAAQNGLVVLEGVNGMQGVVTLVAGQAVVNNINVTANSRIFLTSQVDGGVVGFLRVSARVNGVSFTIKSSSVTDTSTVAYEIFQPY